MSKYKLQIIIVLFIVVLASLTLNNTDNLLLYNYHPVIELSENFDFKANIMKVDGGSIDDVDIDISKINFNQTGKYTMTYTYNNIETVITVEIIDTKIPDLKVKELTIDLGMKVDASDLIKGSYDFKRTTVNFKKNYDFNQVGDYQVELNICHQNKCIIKKTVVHVDNKDTVAPKIDGVRNLTVLKDTDIDLLSSVSVSDNQDDHPTLTIGSSNLDVSKEGNYVITYIAKDRSSNISKETCIVSVVANKEIGTFNQSKEKVVYLTFDDGPSKNTEKVLDILDKYDAKATFFVTGTNEEYFYLIKETYNRGHTIGLHSYVHEYDQIYNSASAYFADLKKIEDLVYKQINFIPKYVRFPGGSSNQISKQYCQKIMTKLTKEIINRGYQYYDWSEDSKDGSGNLNADELFENATKSNENNIVLLFHDANGKESTVAAIEKVIIYYQQKGYIFKGIDDDSYVVHHSVNN